jgi:uncharacterized protein YuzE
MKLTIDHEADALYLNLSEGPVTESDEVAPGIILDYDANERVVGIEMLNLSFRSPAANTRKLLFETVEGAAAAATLSSVLREDEVPYQA